MDLELKLKSIDIEIDIMTKICAMTGDEYPRLNSLKELKKEVLNIRALLGKIETPKMTDTVVVDEVVFKNLFRNIVINNEFVLDINENYIFLSSKLVIPLFKKKNISWPKFCEFLREHKVITTPQNTIYYRLSGKSHRCILIDIKAMSKLLGIEYRDHSN